MKQKPIKVFIKNEETYNKLKEWAKDNDFYIPSYYGYDHYTIFMTDKNIEWCGSFGCIKTCSKDCDIKEEFGITVKDFFKLHTGENIEIKEPEEKFNLNDIVYLKAKIVCGSDEFGNYQVEFDGYEAGTHDWFSQKIITKEIPKGAEEVELKKIIEKQMNQIFDHESDKEALKKKIKTLEKKLDKLRGVIGKRNKYINSVENDSMDDNVDSNNSPFIATQGRFFEKNVSDYREGKKASIMFNNRDLSEEIEQDEMILKNKT